MSNTERRYCIPKDNYATSVLNCIDSYNFRLYDTYYLGEWIRMNKAFDNILDRLDSHIEDAKSEGDFSYIKPFEIAKIAVREAAEEYNDGWIPCSERLPEETEKLYLVTYKKFILGNFRYFMDIAYLSPLPDGTLEWRSEKAPVTRNVEAWQELPEEYKGH